MREGLGIETGMKGVRDEGQNKEKREGDQKGRRRGGGDREDNCMERGRGRESFMTEGGR